MAGPPPQTRKSGIRIKDIDPANPPSYAQFAELWAYYVSALSIPGPDTYNADQKTYINLLNQAADDPNAATDFPNAGWQQAAGGGDGGGG